MTEKGLGSHVPTRVLLPPVTHVPRDLGLFKSPLGTFFLLFLNVVFALTNSQAQKENDRDATGQTEHCAAGSGPLPPRGLDLYSLSLLHGPLGFRPSP